MTPKEDYFYTDISYAVVYAARRKKFQKRLERRKRDPLFRSMIEAVHNRVAEMVAQEEALNEYET